MSSGRRSMERLDVATYGSILRSIAAVFGAALSSGPAARAADPDTFRCEAYPAECGLPATRPPPADPLRVTRGVQLGVRVGYALPIGTLTGRIPTEHALYLSDLFTASVPLGVDVGSRVSRALYLGGTFAWASGIRSVSGYLTPWCTPAEEPCRLPGGIPAARCSSRPACNYGW